MKRKYDNSIKDFESENIRDINLFRFRKNGELHGYNPLVFKKIQDLSKEKESIKKVENDLIYIRDLLKYSSKETIKF